MEPLAVVYCNSKNGLVVIVHYQVSPVVHTVIAEDSTGDKLLYCGPSRQQAQSILETFDRL